MLEEAKQKEGVKESRPLGRAILCPSTGIVVAAAAALGYIL